MPTSTSLELPRAVFHDARIWSVIVGGRLTRAERDFLIADTPRFCPSLSTEAMSALSDKDLMLLAYEAWARFCR